METFQASFFESVCGNEDIKEQTITFFESESTSPEPQNDPPNPETCSNKKESILKPDRPMEETDLIERVNFLEESMKKSHIVLQKLQQENENLKRSKDGNNFQSSNTNIKEKEEYKETIKKIQNENSLLHFKEKQLHGTMEQLEIENEILRQKLDAINSIQEFQQSIDRNDNRIEVSFYESPNTLPMETNLQTSTPLKTQEHQSVNENDLMNLLNVLNKNTEPEISQAETGFAIAATRKSKPRKHKVKENLEESLISVMKIEIEKFIKHKSDLENQISRHLEARESQERYFEEVLKSIKEENISMKRKNADLKDTLQNYDIQFGAIKRCPVAPTDAPRDFLSEYSNLKFKYDELEKKQLETTFELNNLKISHSTLQKEKNDLDARIDEVENDQRTTQKELNESLALNDKLKLELAESRASQQQLRRKLDTSIQTNKKCYTTVFTQ
ncbi:hypothetical protein ROZALSC1DRAFT_29420 [Rozella allomycis CSF55]|uniref:Uncharacterized protein n=1 Tax=Rozella allomycis (strain CSF55) TaxID=988480 RepID=A0A4P9YJC0_ROZAC|nr:hypothetical protein ROZALSC1DRAFT_29420 [Rozella allomycis CSF55]